MTSTLDRRSLPRVPPRASSPERSPLAPGLLAAGWAVGAALVTLGIPVLLAWATDSRSGSGAAAATRAVGQLWLVGHGVAMRVPGGVLGLTPLGLLALPLALLHHAGRHGARSLGVRSLGSAARLVVAVAFPYSVAAAVLAALSRTDQVRPAPVQAMACGLLVAAVGSATGVLREARLGPAAWALVPGAARPVLVGTLGATAVLLGSGSLLAGVSLLLHFGRAAALAGASDPGVVGGLVLLAISLLCVPNAAVWGAAWLAGPGFAVGAGTAVGPFATALGAVPSVPLLAALPSSPVPAWLGGVALAVPVLAGVTGGVLLGRRVSGGSARAAGAGMSVGVATGVVLAALCYLSGGPLGGGHLAEVGPSPWRVALAVALEVGLAAGAAAAAVRR